MAMEERPQELQRPPVYLLDDASAFINSAEKMGMMLDEERRSANQVFGEWIGREITEVVNRYRGSDEEMWDLPHISFARFSEDSAGQLLRAEIDQTFEDKSNKVYLDIDISYEPAILTRMEIISTQSDTTRKLELTKGNGVTRFILETKRNQAFYILDFPTE